MKILIDNGHGINTAGKCSPDKRLREYAYTREIAQRLVSELRGAGYDAQRIVTETTDISLSERCRRVNSICKTHGAKNCVLVSIHNNAAGSGGVWRDARGFSVHISSNASSNSKNLAVLFTETAIKMGLKGNRSIPKTKYWVQSLAMTRDTNCPAVLTENMFQDNKQDVDFLLSEDGMSAIVKLHFDVLTKYVKEVAK